MSEQPQEVPEKEVELVEPKPAKSERGVMVGGLVIIAILLALIITQVRPDPGAADSAERSRIARLESAINAERQALNIEREKAGLPPITFPALEESAGKESPAAIAERLGADARRLATFAEEMERVIRRKDEEVAAGAMALAESEKQLSGLAKQISSLQEQLEDGAPSAELVKLRRRAKEAADRSAESEKALAAANVRLAEYENAPSAADYEDLQRRHEESRSARDFFEQRAMALEEQFEDARRRSEAPSGTESEDGGDLPLPKN